MRNIYSEGDRRGKIYNESKDKRNEDMTVFSL